MKAVREALNAYGSEEVEALLPYLLDPFGLTTRLATRGGTGDHSERRARKEIGTFYTPGDVARLLAENAVDGDGPVFDPACGTGVLLRAAFSRLCCDLAVPPDQALGCLYGMDIDPRAIDACALVLAHDFLARLGSRSGDGETAWRLARLNLAVADSLSAFSPRKDLGTGNDDYPQRRHKNRLDLRGQVLEGQVPRPALAQRLDGASPWVRFPECAENGFSSVLMNPPFAAAEAFVGSRPVGTLGYRSLEAARKPAGVNLAWPFVEIALASAKGPGAAGIVLPLSIAYLRDPATTVIRSAMADAGGWQMRFFDRAPDAVFGDDVKQRISLAVMRRSEPRQFSTSSLIRWSSPQRAKIFRSGATVFVESPGQNGEAIPKIGSQIEAKAFATLACGETLEASLLSAKLARADQLIDAETAAVFVAPTAYNWIGAYRDPRRARAGRRETSGMLSVLTFETKEQADAAYAVIASRVYLWWWRAVGDLFHVPQRMLLNAPFPLPQDAKAFDRLVASGRSLWTRALANEIRATNRGKTTISYCPPRDCSELKAADEATAKAVALPPGFVRFVREDADRLANAGRDLRA